MGRPVFLFGAGASIDSGLCDTNMLTEKIYEMLDQNHYKVPQKIFGYAISKVITRKVRKGLSPFASVNVEEAYDAVEKIALRHEDIVSEFVTSWDPFLSSLSPQFDAEKFSRNLESIIDTRRRSLNGGISISIDRSRVRDVARQISEATAPSSSKQSEVIPYLLGALLMCLNHDPNRVSHVEKIVQYASENGGIIGSLNYDLVVENAAKNLSLTYDYGISNWNSKRIVTFSGSKASIKLHKLHGSMNWSGNDDNINIVEKDNRNPLLVFGNGNSKLRADGPFLQMRHEFERQLLATNTLIIIGYSFSDIHLNAIVRRWSSTRRKAKLIIVEPGRISYSKDRIGTTHRMENGKFSGLTVEIFHIKKTFFNAVDDIIDCCSRPIDLNIDKSKNGIIPDIYAKIVA